jgi:sugar O-acyltransferase (sialic acid O-acetyltransferase NeuD family)
MEKLHIFGAGVRASVVTDLIQWDFADRILLDGYYDDNVPAGTPGPAGRPVLGTVAEGIEAVARSGTMAFVALGTFASARGCQVFLELRSRQVNVPHLVSPRAHVSPSACLGENVLIMPGVFVGSQVTIGHMTCAHGGVAIEHNTRIGHNVLLGPGVALAGYVTVGSHSFLGAGCSIIPEVTLGSGVLLGAGAVVVRDIPSYSVARGCPARTMRQVRAGEEIPLPAQIHELAQLGLAEFPW